MQKIEQTDEIDFSTLEKKWQKEWEKKKIFHAEDKGKKYYVLEMFPYPSASGLHIGHALNYTIGDIYARLKRMQGWSVLYPMGFDAFGLPAENAAVKANEHPKPFTEKAMENYTRQMKELGLSYDWSRTLRTCDEEYYKWNQYFFIKLFEVGLVYRKKSAVNWCPKCQTVLANEQVQGGVCWRHEDTNVEIKQLEQWYIKTTKYAEELLNEIPRLNWPERIKLMQENWIGKSHGVEIDFSINDKPWKIFTTRPDTIYGVTFIVVSAQHPRLMELVTKEKKKDVEEFLKKLKSVSEKELEEMGKEGVFTGSYAINPLTKEKVPVWAGNFVVADYGSGMVMAVPAHDARDFEFAKKYNIPIKEVISPKETKIITIEKSLKKEFYKSVEKLGKIIIKEGLVNIYTDKVDEVFKLAENNFIGAPWYIHSEGKIKKILFHSEKADEIFFWDSDKALKIAKDYGKKIKINEKQLDFHELREAFTEAGILVNSDKFSGLDSRKAKEEIIKYLEEKKLGRKTTNYKLRDWLVSRQRYWGTPIPMVYCDKCVIVPEKNLPVILPDKVKFGEGNPLATNKEFVECKCPKCKGKARRETYTMDTFFDSSWYYLRYADNKNKKEAFDKKKVAYWMPVDQYIGGAEHACMHLIYARFFTKALRDLGFLNFGEPFSKLFNQGMLHGSDGEKMSKSKGNVILPEDVSKKYGMDTARLFLMSQASPDKDTSWSEAGIEGSLRIVRRIMNYFEKIKVGKSSEMIQSKIHKTITEYERDIENFNYNLGIIKLRTLFEAIEKESEISKEDAGIFIKLLSPICPHIAEEIWHNLGNKSFVSIESWPVADEKKINLKLEQQEKAIEKTVNDIQNIFKIINKPAKKVYLYVIPPELDMYKNSKEAMRGLLNADVEVFAVNDDKKFDPENKAGKAKMGKPAIYVES